MGDAKTQRGRQIDGRGGCSAVVGLQWGDEGKGKVIDLFAPAHDAIVRYNGGANAGNSVVVGGERYALHLVPTGILHPGKLCVIANGVVVDPSVLIEEVRTLRSRGVDVSGLVVSDRAHVVLPYHKLEDGLREDYLRARAPTGERAPGTVGQIGTTRRGIGPAYADKVNRTSAVRVGDLLRPDVLRGKVELACIAKRAVFAGLIEGTGLDPASIELPDPEAICREALAAGEELRPIIRDTTWLLHDLLAEGRRVLFAGANAALLDVDHGTYPFVTSSNATVLGAGPGTGVPGSRIDRAVGVVKAYSTRVGGGPFPTELLDDGPNGDIARTIRERGREYGTTTGRPRRIGWLDLVAVRYAAMINGITELAVTLFDVLGGLDEVKVCRAYQMADGRETDRFCPDADALGEVRPVYETLAGFGPVGSVRSLDELPPGALAYLELIEEATGLPISVVGIGPGREQTILA